jgi:hypothetical protein
MMLLCFIDGFFYAGGGQSVPLLFSGEFSNPTIRSPAETSNSE